MADIFLQYFITFGWALTGAISVAISLGIALKVFDFLTPINEWEEIKKGNMAVATIMASIILGMCIVIGLTVMT